MSSPGQQRPDPAAVFDMLQAHQRSAALRAAIELDLFRAIGEGPADAATIAARINSSERGTRILCDFLAISGVLAKENSVYSHSAVSATFLDPRSPVCIASTAKFMGNPLIQDTYKQLSTIVREGRTVMPGQGTVEPDNPLWVEFAESMAPMMAVLSGPFASIALDGLTGPVKVLDIAAGHGLFGIALAKQNPKAEITGLDWATVLEVAKANAEKAGVADRYSTIPGSAFEVDYGSGYDLVFLTNFLHHFDHATNVALLRKVYAALKPGGRAVTLEFVPNSDRITPPVAAAFSMTMLVGTVAGDAFTFSELAAMHKEADFGEVTEHAMPIGPESVVVAVKS